jgi:predicted anti-sigma-YlaC factor YlaD
MMTSPRGLDMATMGRLRRGPRHEDAEGAGRPNARSWIGFNVLVLSVLALAMTGCSIRRLAVNKLGDALAGGGTSFASDDDPDLVKDAAPFSLKLMESLLAESPQHLGLRLASASGFTQYAYAFVHEAADEIEDRDLAAATALRARARRLYLRARSHGLRGLEISHPGFEQALRAAPKTAVARLKRQDVPLVYWTTAAWGAAIGLSKDNPDLVAEVPIAEALLDRAFELQPDYGNGAIHSFLITYEMSRQGAKGDPAARARHHFDQAVELSHGQQAAPFVSLAEAVCVQKQQVKEFEAVLGRALAINPDAHPETRLLNLVMQRRARWLLSRKEDLFLLEPAK